MKRLHTILTTILAACIPFGAGAGVFDCDTLEKPVTAALVLHFNVTEDSTDVNSMDFYAGTLLALKEFKEAGYRVALKVMDADRVLNESDRESPFEDCDLIIGPVDRVRQKEILETASSCDIPFVSAIDRDAAVHIEGNCNFFQIPASFETRTENLVESVKNGPDGPVTVFYSTATAADAKWMKMVEDALNRRSIQYEKTTYDVLNGRVIFEKYSRTMALPEGQTNKVIIASEDAAFASDVVRNMALLAHSGIPVAIYGSPRLMNLNTIDSETLYTVNFHTSTPFYVDYGDEATIEFINSFRENFDAEPTPYAFQGYDTFLYFMRLIFELGDGFQDFIEYYPMDLLQNSIRMSQKPSDTQDVVNGFLNTATRNVEYTPDGRIVVRKF